MIQPGMKAPDFSGQAVVNGKITDIKLTDYKNKYVLLVFYPLDYTFVCPTEIIAFSDSVKEFENRGCQVIACSTDSAYCHLSWTKLDRKQGGLGQVNIPLLSDKSMNISRSYGVLNEQQSIPYRGSFLIDPNGVLRQITINDLPVGRSVEESLRLLDAFIFHSEHGDVCPVNWKPNSKTMKPDPEGSKEYFASTY